MAPRGENPPKVMSPATSFHCHNARPKLADETFQRSPPKSPPQNNPAGGVHPHQAARVLAKIDAENHDIHRSAPLSKPTAILPDRRERGGPSHNHKFRDRRGEVLFIDARKLGVMADRTHRDLSDADIAKIAGIYHLWRGEKNVPVGAVDGLTAYEDIPGFCKAAKRAEIEKHGFVLSPGRYVGAAEAEEDEEPFEGKITRLVADLRAQQADAARLDAAIAANLRELGYGG